MKKCIIALLFILVGCSNNETSTVQSANEDVKYTEEELQEAIDTAVEEAIEEAYDEGYAAGNDEGYKMGYGDAMNEATPVINTEPEYTNSISGLNIYSDGFEWSVSTNLSKKDFVKSVAKKSNQFLTFSEVEEIVMAIDIYYENNLKLKTLKEALEDIM